MDVTALLLAGGKSSRMGTNKALLPMFEKTSIENISEELKKVARQVLIVTNSPDQYEFLGLPMVKDEYEGMGPLGGLHAGLTASKTDTVFVSACDMPFIKAAVMEEMLSKLDDYDALVPEIEGRLHPLFSIYRKACLPSLIDCLHARELKMTHFLDKVKVKIMKHTEFQLYAKNHDLFSLLFYNMNNPEEYEKARKLETHFNTQIW
ncbi:molybdenum cofactor guanylyltransferase [Bacillus sp. V5-8f]|uniref:molybdenum cofactor guanylyltransferase n=1 Tax=Bacillus sp. V5-8f TaxID=2053044 RepID=UPI000C78AD19|nr:molybdenum cofactor guanylyltransferase [Bacillus sp. V5-8f]PLT35926.1 molybdenum cofactor guanylyltransferase [Bacillus sp. V5-8f]